jgi:Flp pilus assembly protein TadG
LLFLLFFGFVDVGRAIMVKNQLTSAARDGARTATLDGATVAGVQSQVTDFLVGATISGVTVNVTPSPLDTAEIGDPVSVNVTVPFGSVSWLPSSLYFGGATLESTVVMRRETN